RPVASRPSSSIVREPGLLPAAGPGSPVVAVVTLVMISASPREGARTRVLARQLAGGQPPFTNSVHAEIAGTGARARTRHLGLGGSVWAGRESGPPGRGGADAACRSGATPRRSPGGGTPRGRRQ